MPITALPTPPSRTRPSTFSAEGDAFLAALPTFVTEANAQAVTINNDKITSAASALAASNSVDDAIDQVALAAAEVVLAAAQVDLAEIEADRAEAAALSAATIAGVIKWVAGSYLLGDAVYSPLDLITYRARSNFSSVTDPSLDGTNWAATVPLPNHATFLKYQW